jgi:hypothetical protein
MYKTGVLEDFITTVSKVNEEYVVKYSKGEYKGECRYKMMELMGTNKPIRQTPMLLTHCNMGDIIEKIHLEHTLSSEDFHSLSMEIREHSLLKLSEFMSVLNK